MSETPRSQVVMGIDLLEDAIRSLKATKVLFVIDASFPHLFVASQIEAMKLPHLFFDHFTPNPLYEDVLLGVAAFRDNGCDAIVAIGGGSTIDVAKCIKLYAPLPPDFDHLHAECPASAVPLIAMPTTAGTGSESTRYAVIYYNGVKQSVTHDSIIPDVAILEPRLLSTLPPYQRRCTVMDALCQAIESWWSVNATPYSQQLSRRAVETLDQYIDAYIFGTGSSGRDHEVAVQIATAANIAGQAINITQTTAPHAFSYKLTSLYHLPHGHAVAISLPHIWRYMLEHSDKSIHSAGETGLLETFQHIAEALHRPDPYTAIATFETRLRAYGFFNPQSTDKKRDLRTLVENVNPVRLKNNPVLLDKESIESIYNLVLNNN